MTASKLSEIPGVGPVRKKQLLLKFGDMKSIANATIDEISKVDGFNTSLAETIYDFFIKLENLPNMLSFLDS